jgi:meiotically up-regulated gene 157 (Mug157) protein
MKKTLPKSMERFLAELKEKAAAHPQWMEQFYTCYTNTLDTTVKKMDDGTVHVITGDIPAMWLRDSTAQLRPYVFLAKEDAEIKELLIGLVKRQFSYLCTDIYANAMRRRTEHAGKRTIPTRVRGYGSGNLKSIRYAIRSSLLTYYGKMWDARSSLMQTSKRE